MIMQPEKVIEYLSDRAVCRGLPEEYDWAVDTAKEALEKQIPKKPSVNFAIGNTYYHCPNSK